MIKISAVCVCFVLLLPPLTAQSQPPQRRSNLWAVAGDHPFWETLSSNFKYGGMLIGRDEDATILKAIELGLEDGEHGFDQIARVVNIARSQRSPHAGLDLDFVGENSFNLKRTEKSDLWTSAMLSFLSKDTNDTYKAVRAERRRGTKSLYHQFAGLRSFRQFADGDFEDRQQKRSQIAELLWTSTDKGRFAKTKTLRQQVRTSMQTDSRSANLVQYDPLVRSHRLGLNDFLDKLPDNTAIIEIIRYSKFTPKPNVGLKEALGNAEPHYVAFVLTTGNTKGQRTVRNFASPNLLRTRNVRSHNIHRVELGQCEAIDSLGSQWRKEINNEKTQTSALKLSSKLWQPLKKHLEEVESLYLVADGRINEIPWSALPIEEGQFLIQKYKIAHLPFAEYLIQGQSQGPIDQISREKKQKDVVVVDGVAKNLKFGDRMGEHIKNLYPNANLHHLQQNATATKVTTLLPSAAIVHFATHGAYGENARNNFRAAIGETPQDALYFSSLELADSRKEDSLQSKIITADMISELNLSNMDLAILAACETGIGENNQAEGNFALPRSFHLAGCRDVVSSLWRVKDQATFLILREFHSNLKNGMAPMDALCQVQRDAISGKLKLPRNSDTNREGLTGKTRKIRAKSKADIESDPDTGRDWSVNRWAAFRISGPGNRKIDGLKKLSSKSGKTRDGGITYAVFSQNDPLKRQAARIDEIINEQLDREAAIRGSIPGRKSKQPIRRRTLTAEEYDKAFNKLKSLSDIHGLDYFYSVRLQKSVSPEAMKEIADEIKPELMSSRDKFVATFFLPDIDKSFAKVVIRKGSARFSQTGLGDDALETFFKTPIVLEGKRIGKWQDDFCILQLEKNKNIYTIHRYFPNGKTKSTELTKRRTIGKRQIFTAKNGMEYEILPDGDFWFGWPNRKKTKCAAIRVQEIKKLGLEAQQALAVHKLNICELVEQLIAMRNDNFGVDASQPREFKTVKSNASKFDYWFEQVGRLESFQPTGDHCFPMEVRAAPRELKKIGSALYGQTLPNSGKPDESQNLHLEQLKLTLDYDKFIATKNGAPLPPASFEPLADLAKSRIWKDKSGKFRVRASLIWADTKRVFLKKEDDQSSITVPINKLSEADVRYVRKVLEKAELNDAK